MSAIKFSFVLHLLLSEEIEERGLSLEIIPSGVPVDKEVKAMLKQAQIVQYGSTMQITSQTGVSCIGTNWIIPLTPQMIFQNQNLALEMTVNACQMAKEQGAETIGLALMLGKIGRRGQDVRERVDIPITNGDCYLVFNSLQVLMKLLDFFEWDPKDEKVAVYGFPSTIGTLLAKYLLSSGISVILITKQTPYVQKLINGISDKYPASLELAPTIQEAQRNSRIIFTVGSEQQVVNAHEIVKPAVIIDVSIPRNGNALINSRKALVIDAGMVSLARSSLNVSGFYPNQILPCLAELIVLSLEGRKEDYSLGKNLTLRKVEEIGRLAQKYGLVLDRLYSFGKPVNIEHLTHFKDVLKVKRI